MTLALVDCRISKKAEKALCDYSDKIIKLPPHPMLATPVAAHPDMLLWRCADKLAVLNGYGAVAEDELRTLSDASFELIETPEVPTSLYPRDVLLNCATVGDSIIANTKYVSEIVKSSAEARGMNLLHTPQGYAKCSTVVLDGNAVITADRSIHRVAEANGISSLLISAGHVRLDGYDHGFLGGASATTKSYALFFGDLASHPDGESIYSFCSVHGKTPVSLTDEPLYDYGTGIFIEI